MGSAWGGGGRVLWGVWIVPELGGGWGFFEQAAGGRHAPVVQVRDPVGRDAQAAVPVDHLGPLLTALDRRAGHDAVRVVDPEPAVLERPSDRGERRALLGRLCRVA